MKKIRPEVMSRIVELSNNIMKRKWKKMYESLPSHLEMYEENYDDIDGDYFSGGDIAFFLSDTDEDEDSEVIITFSRDISSGYWVDIDEFLGVILIATDNNQEYVDELRAEILKGGIDDVYVLYGKTSYTKLLVCNPNDMISKFSNYTDRDIIYVEVDADEYFPLEIDMTYLSNIVYFLMWAISYRDDNRNSIIKSNYTVIELLMEVFNRSGRLERISLPFQNALDMSY